VREEKIMRRQRDTEPQSSEAGMALLITVIVLLLVSAIGISALNRAGDETAVAGSSRRKISTLQAANAGLAMLEKQFEPVMGQAALIVPPPLNERELMVDHNGLATSVRSGTIETSVPQPIKRVGQSQDRSNELRAGSTGGRARFIYRVEVVATDPSGGNVQLQSQFSVVDNSGGGLGVY
jgi:Tfp pilus assembly protein PilX